MKNTFVVPIISEYFHFNTCVFKYFTLVIDFINSGSFYSLPSSHLKKFFLLFNSVEEFGDM